jgi:glucose-6-phosphate 1-dehydrogenase
VSGDYTQPPPQKLFADARPEDGRASYLRFSFKLQPVSAVALAARVRHPGKAFTGKSPYERP